MTKSSSSSSSAQSTTLPLRSLQEIHNRIIQKKGEIHKSHNRVTMKRYGRDRNIAMDLGSNTNATATITSYIKKVCFFEPHQIFFGIKEIVIGLMAYR